MTQDRPDYVTCIRKGASKESLCGRYLGFGFAFVHLRHALASEAARSRLVLCEDCRKSIGSQARS